MIELLNNKRLIQHEIKMNDKIMFKRNYQFRQNVLEISKYKKIGNYNTYIENNKIIKINNNNNNDNESEKQFEIIGKDILKNPELFEQIKIKLIEIIRKNKLPSFNIEDYKKIKQIGEGTYGKIYEVINKKTNKKYALKLILASSIEKLEIFLKEFEISHSNHHENILNIFGIFIRCIENTKYSLYILMDLAKNDWDTEIKEREKNNNYYTEKELIIILKQINSVLLFLQNNRNIAHRDIKPENILIFNNNIYKLCDFGEAKISPDLKRQNSLRGTQIYMSPILYNCLKNNIKRVQHNIYKSDIFSLGYCFLYAASLNFNIINAIRDLKFQGLVDKMLDKYMKSRYSIEFIEIISKMINVDEQKRIDFNDLNILLEEKYNNI